MFDYLTGITTIASLCIAVLIWIFGDKMSTKKKLVITVVILLGAGIIVICSKLTESTPVTKEKPSIKTSETIKSLLTISIEPTSTPLEMTPTVEESSPTPLYAEFYQTPNENQSLLPYVDKYTIVNMRELGIQKNVYYIDNEGNKELLTNEYAMCSIYVDAEWIYFYNYSEKAKERGIYRMTIDGSYSECIYNDLVYSYYLDNEKIYLLVRDYNLIQHVYVMDKNGTNLKKYVSNHMITVYPDGGEIEEPGEIPWRTLEYVYDGFLCFRIEEGFLFDNPYTGVRFEVYPDDYIARSPIVYEDNIYIVTVNDGLQKREISTGICTKVDTKVCFIEDIAIYDGLIYYTGRDKQNDRIKYLFIQSTDGNSIKNIELSDAIYIVDSINISPDWIVLSAVGYKQDGFKLLISHDGEKIVEIR